MTLNITTQATNGHLILYVINSNGIKIMTLTDTAQGGCMLVPGHTYRFEWHTWSSQAASYQINANVNPVSPGFLPFNFLKNYPAPNTDMGGFYFTV